MPKESKLSKHKLKFEDTKGKLKLSPTAGKPKPLVVRAFEATINSIVGFFRDTFVAIKVIVREIM